MPKVTIPYEQRALTKDQRTLLKLINRLDSARIYAHNAKVRAIECAGFETGRKALARFEYWDGKYSEALSELYALVPLLHVDGFALGILKQK